MSRDIYLDDDGELKVADTDVYKGENILRVQVNFLVYAPNLGIDLARFIDPSVTIQPETFKSYTVQELVRQGVRIETVKSNFNALDTDLTYTASEPGTQEAMA